MHCREMLASGHWRQRWMLAAICLMFLGGFAGGTTDPCPALASFERRHCRSACAIERRAALAGCVALEPSCVTPCRVRYDGCRLGLLPIYRADCRENLVSETLACLSPESPLPDGFNGCRLAAVAQARRCSTDAGRAARSDQRQCRRRYDTCLRECSPASPSDDADPTGCVDSAASAFTECDTGCELAAAGVDSACRSQQPACLLECTLANRGCQNPSRAALKAGLRTCKVTLGDALLICDQLPRGDQPARQACIDAAERDAETCRAPVASAARRELLLCATGFSACLGACGSGLLE
jgi:hypothetical protein